VHVSYTCLYVCMYTCMHVCYIHDTYTCYIYMLHTYTCNIYMLRTPYYTYEGVMTHTDVTCTCYIASDKVHTLVTYICIQNAMCHVYTRTSKWESCHMLQNRSHVTCYKIGVMSHVTHTNESRHIAFRIHD